MAQLCQELSLIHILETYLVVALIYLVLTTAAMLILRRIEQRLRAGGMVQ